MPQPPEPGSRSGKRPAGPHGGRSPLTHPRCPRCGGRPRVPHDPELPCPPRRQGRGGRFVSQAESLRLSADVRKAEHKPAAPTKPLSRRGRRLAAEIVLRGGEPRGLAAAGRAAGIPNPWDLAKAPEVQAEVRRLMAEAGITPESLIKGHLAPALARAKARAGRRDSTPAHSQEHRAWWVQAMRCAGLDPDGAQAQAQAARGPGPQTVYQLIQIILATRQQRGLLP